MLRNLEGEEAQEAVLTSFAMQWQSHEMDLVSEKMKLAQSLKYLQSICEQSVQCSGPLAQPESLVVKFAGRSCLPAV